MGNLVLSIFPGIDLLGRAFEEEGYCVVRGPDLLWGGDIRSFHPPVGVFDGVIGGPPCQPFSSAGEIIGTTAEDQVPEFVRVVHEAEPTWVVMENVTGAIGHPAIPEGWFPAILRDWDCGGLTSRRRAFWTWPFAALQYPRRPGSPSKSVMATTWKRGASTSKYVGDKGYLPGDLPLEEYGRLQGAPEVVAALKDCKAGKAFVVHVLGNGVPLPMGRMIAQAVKRATNGAQQAEPEG